MQPSQAVNPAPLSLDRLPPVRRPRHPAIRGLTALVAALVLLPVMVLIGVGVTGSGEDWPHLLQNVLPRSTATTLWLLALVSAGTASIGVTTAWLIVAYDFPMRRVLAWALVLPVAVPPYLAAYAFGEFFHFTGPVQSALRAIFGWQSPRDYWFPDIRSTEGAALVLSAVLYPYVYMTTRVVFLMQGRNIADVARTLGARPGTVFRRILLPVARPAIIAGVALVLMETLNDIGAVEYLGVRTLTFSVYSTWLNRGSLEGAAQIAAVMMVIVFAILMTEQWARRKQGFHAARATHIKARPARLKLTGWRAAAAFLAVLLPILAGFGIPIQVLGRFAVRRLDQLFEPALQNAFLSSVAVAAATAVVTVGLALLLLNAARLVRRPGVLAMARISTIGYALPGTILGLGLLFALARIDNTVDALARDWFGFSTGLLISGTAGAVIYACTIRFMALAEGTIRSGMEKLPRNIDDAARSLGCSPARSARIVLLPLLTPAIMTAGVLVFVDTVKELSATILLRPFGFSTLATHVYENASRGVVEDGAVAALLIIVTALVPVMLLSRALMRDEAS
ncbi:MAG: iron ABC transporter permease [Zhengella sp.]|uniref:ABC transporter permease n=1 Tax=Zhengella sp. TaxID=2282762 RepID=UPI001DCBE0A2|nr:iron ABC transporter permease [Notoacmeibacter sp.]MCC0026471.1 iron ABC transporter permease [Brucellaceae bacterium]